MFGSKAYLRRAENGEIFERVLVGTCGSTSELQEDKKTTHVGRS